MTPDGSHLCFCWSVWNGHRGPEVGECKSTRSSCGYFLLRLHRLNLTQICCCFLEVIGGVAARRRSSRSAWSCGARNLAGRPFSSWGFWS